MMMEDICMVSQTVESLFSNAELFKMIINEAPFGIAVTDSLTGDLYAINPMFARIAGRSMEEMNTVNWMSLTYHEDIQKDLENMALLNSGVIEGFRMEKRYVRPDGVITWIDMKIVPMKAIELENLCHLCIIEDITDRKKKENELVTFSRAVRQSPVSISPILNSKGICTNFLAVIEDISEKKKALAQLEAAREKAESSDRLKTAFLQNISHEIRTPLNGIMGIGGLLLQPDLTIEEKKQFHSLIQSSSNRLLSTINNYMDMSLIVSGNMDVKLQTADLSALFRSLRQQFLTQCNDKQIELRLNTPQGKEPCYFYTDAGLFRKIFIHLLDNAVKFTNQGTITIGYREKPGTLEFFIQDTGIGVAKDAQEKIFETFVQEEVSHSRGHEGSGLGLSIAQGLVALLGGKILVDSVKDKGSVFSFTLPHKLSGHSEVPSRN